MFNTFTKSVALTFVAMLVSLTAAAYDFEVGGIYYNVVSTTDFTCSVAGHASSADVVSLTIPETVSYSNRELDVVSIGAYAFNSEKHLQTVIVGSNVKTLGESAFAQSSVRKVVLSEGVESIGKNCFSHSKLTEINLPSTMKSLELRAFEYSAIKGIEMGNGIESVGQSCFMGCSLLEKVVLSECMEAIPTSAFSQTSNLKEIVIPNSVKVINAYAFNGSGIVTATIGDSSKPLVGNVKIDYEAFKLCANLTTLNLAASVSDIEITAFYGSDAIRIINCYNAVAPQVYKTKLATVTSSNLFSNKVLTDAVLNVPVGSEASYKNAEYWKNFWNINPSIENVNEVYSYNVWINYADTYGRVKVNGVDEDHAVVYSNNDLVYTFVPDAGYHLKSVTINKEDVTDRVVDNTLTIENIDKDQELRVEFARTVVSLTIASGAEGVLTTSVDQYTSHSFAITANEGWLVSSVTFNNADVTSRLENCVFTTPEIAADSELRIVYVEDGTMGAESADVASAVNVLAMRGAVDIVGAADDEVADVYDLSGRHVVSTADKHIELAAGNVYVIKIAGKTFKVAV